METFNFGHEIPDADVSCPDFRIRGDYVLCLTQDDVDALLDAEGYIPLRIATVNDKMYRLSFVWDKIKEVGHSGKQRGAATAWHELLAAVDE